MARHTFFCIDGHTAGMPVRMVVGGAPYLKGNNQAEKREYFMQHFDWIRTALTMEPRGHAFMSGTLLYPPSSDDFDMGLIFIETSASLPMCGHATIGSVTFAIEHGLVHPKTPGVVRVETPAGLVEANYELVGNKVKSVKFTNVPSFLLYQGVEIDIAGLGALKVDVAYGGNFYAIVEQQPNFRDITDFSIAELLSYGRAVQQAVNKAVEVKHPEIASIKGLQHCLWSGPDESGEYNNRIVVIAGDHLVDRSPCGTGTSARVAQRASKGLLKMGQQFVHQSLTGGRFIGRIEQEVQVGPLQGVRPSVEGQAYVTALNTIFVDSNEPYADGFLID
ncbi:4-hydroxyproline epimerase [Vogesella sp. LYT5W]|uniref:4-hydroxyproline epimerase n=1 Tax=Vogesella margarita TaxID=2984199 RepID=A0ABT5IM52_9NEIS|nr:4-hydroxyproline epimerase [Vogesella margarita]MDC7713648.1 4-hydroxyproline epimerase [Vogesella margarita]